MLLDDQGALAVDVRIIVRQWQPGRDRYSHMAIYPYPAHLERQVHCRDGMPMTVRPIRPEDAAMHRGFFHKLSDETRYKLVDETALRELSPAMMVRFTQLDYAREMALIGVVQEHGEDAIVGVIALCHQSRCRLLRICTGDPRRFPRARGWGAS